MPNDAMFQAIEALIRRTTRFGFKELFIVSDVVIQDGSLNLDETSISHMPQKVEESNFRYANCTGDERSREMSETVKTTRSVALRLMTEYSTHIESNVGIRLGTAADFAQFNGDLIQKADQTITNDKTHTFSEEITKSISEQIKIKPHTQLTVSARIVKGLVKAKVSGEVVVDARVYMLFGDAYSFGPNEPMWVQLSDTYHFPLSDRRITLNGEIASESYQDTDMVYLEKELAPNDPICSDNPSAQPNIMKRVDFATVISRDRPDIRLLVRAKQVPVRGLSDSCASTIVVNFSSDGHIDFDIVCTGCPGTNPSGRFEYDAIIDQGNGVAQPLNRRFEWGPFVGASSGTASDNISLSPGESLVAVTVHSEECNC